MASFRAAFAELLEPRLRKVYFNQYKMEPLLYPMLANVISSKRAHEDTIKVSGLGVMTQKAEGTPISYTDPVQGARKRVVHVTYALGFRVTMEMQQDDLYNIIDKMPADLGDATKDHQENLFWGIFNDAFAGAVHTGLDTAALCTTAHVLLKPKPGGAVSDSNQVSPGVALSVTGLETAITQMRLTLNESGRQTPIRPSKLVIHSNNAHEAFRLLETVTEPHTAENQLNSVATSRTGITPLDVPYLTDTDAWFIVAPKNQHSLIWYKRMGNTFSRGGDSQTKDALFDAMYRASVTFDDWRGVVGSAP
jgi:phage major head subunit gpT-like protein